MSRTRCVISKAKELFQNSTAGNDVTISMNLIHNKKTSGAIPQSCKFLFFDL